MPAGPIPDLTAWIERAGIFVIHANLPDAAMDGVTIRAPDAPPCIFLNRSQPADRMRFSLAHELAHLVMHRIPDPNMEAEAMLSLARFWCRRQISGLIFMAANRFAAPGRPETRMARCYGSVTLPREAACLCERQPSPIFMAAVQLPQNPIARASRTGFTGGKSYTHAKTSIDAPRRVRLFTFRYA